MNMDILVNRDNRLDKDYIPANLIEIKCRTPKNIDENSKVFLVDCVLEEFKNMRKDALLLGYDIDIDDGYRSYEFQQKVLEYYMAKYGDRAYFRVALPGCSEHQTGLAIDVALFINGKYLEDITGKEKEIIWLHQNVYKYGFIVRYPIASNNNKDEPNQITGIIYEPWHIRYVGLELSKYLYDNDLTLEEYHSSKTKEKTKYKH